MLFSVFTIRVYNPIEYASRYVHVRALFWDEETTHEGAFLSLIMLKALVVLGSMLATAVAQTADAAAPAAPADAAAAPSAPGRTPKEEFARKPMAATQHSIAVERERGNTNVPEPPLPCAKEISKPCQQNLDCVCTGFCYFKKGSDVLSGTCEKYNRVIHAA